MLAAKAERGSVVTSDGVRLSTLTAGTGRPLVMIPGWSQTAVQWHAQIDALSATHRVIALDMRGHGQSDTPDHGYRVARLAKDVRDAMVALDLSDAVLMGHSMGAAVLLCLYDLFGADRIRALILVDEPAWLLDSAMLTDAERDDAGASISADAVVGVARGLSGPDGDTLTAKMLRSMFTAGADPVMVDAVVALNLAFPRALAARLIFNNVCQDWRDVYPRIAVPTLCIGGRASVVNWRSVEWQSRTVPNAELAILEAGEGGSHFAFMENPERFNTVVADFLDRHG